MYNPDGAKLIAEIQELREATILAAEVVALKRAQHVYNKVARHVPTK